jgi:hypothetical protein
MGKRIFLFVVGMFIALLAERFWVGHAGRAADDCMTKPGVAAPQGSHWYYRLDHTNHRQCWYLAAEGAKVRPHARQAASPVKPQSVKPIARLEASGDDASPETPAQAIPAQPASVEMTVGQAGADENDSAPGSSRNWSFLSALPVSNSRDAVYATLEFEKNQPDATPLLPLVAPAEPQVAESPDDRAAARWNTFLVAEAGFAAMIVAVAFAAFTVHKRSPANAQRRPASSSIPARRGEQAFATVAARVTAPAGQTEMARNKAQARRPAIRSVDDTELRVRRLLHELQQRQHEPRVRDPAFGKLTG